MTRLASARATDSAVTTAVKLVSTSLALTALLATIIATPALAQEPPKRPKTVVAVAPAPAVVCTVRELAQGSGSVRTCAVPSRSVLGGAQ